MTAYKTTETRDILMLFLGVYAQSGVLGLHANAAQHGKEYYDEVLSHDNGLFEQQRSHLLKTAAPCQELMSGKR